MVATNRNLDLIVFFLDGDGPIQDPDQPRFFICTKNLSNCEKLVILILGY